jgi:hypothetical protein
MKKTKTLHRELTRVLEHQLPATTTSTVMSSVFLRNAETLHLPMMLSGGIRHATFSGK